MRSGTLVKVTLSVAHFLLRVNQQFLFLMFPLYYHFLLYSNELFYQQNSPAHFILYLKVTEEALC